MSSDEKVAEFISFTGAGPEDARQYLEMADGNLEQAVSLFMEMGGGGGGAASAAAAGAAGGGAAVSGRGGEDEVRAPIAAFDDQIINVEAEQQRIQQAIRADAAAMERRMSFDREQDAVGGEWTCSKCKNQNFNTRPQCFNCGTSKAAQAMEPAQKAINELFKPPDYNEVDPFFKTLEKAKVEGKYVLVNIQQSEAFTSHALNRDVWREESIQDLVSENFVFWQRDNLSTEGAQFVKTYKCEEALPHVCVIDPRTGRSVKSWKGERFASYAMEKLIEFMDSFPAPTGDAAPLAVPAPAAPAAAAGPPSSGSAGAMPAEAASVAAPEPPLVAGQRLAGDAAGTAAAVADAEAEELTGQVAVMPEEPTADAEHVKVSFRLPSGQRVMRRLRPDDTMEVVFAVASALTSSPVHGIDVSTQMPKKSLRDAEGGLTLSVKDSKIAGNMLVVETGKRRRVA